MPTLHSSTLILAAGFALDVTPRPDTRALFVGLDARRAYGERR